MKGKDEVQAGCECIREGGRRGGQDMVKECRKVMVRKDRSVFRKWEKKGGKRRSETQRETGREIRLQRFSAGTLHLSLGSLT